MTHGPHPGSRATSNRDPESPNLMAQSALLGGQTPDCERLAGRAPSHGGSQGTTSQGPGPAMLTAVFVHVHGRYHSPTTPGMYTRPPRKLQKMS